MKNLLTTKRTFQAVLFIGLFAMAARDIIDPDVWWHLKTGQYISEHASVPHTDPFSFTRAGQPWVAHEWLSELLMYQIQHREGWGGLVVIFAAVVAAAFFFLYLRCGAAPYVAGLVTLAGAWACRPLWGVRPQMLSLLLTSLWLLILERSEKKPILLWWTPPLTLLWVNLHAGFALGLAISALFLTGRWLEQGLGLCSSEARPATRTAMLVLFLDLLLVPLNPNGFRLFSYPVETLRSAAMQKYIAEWASPNFHRWEYWPVMGIVLGTFAVLRWSRRPAATRDLLLMVVSLYAALCSIRLLPFFVLIAAPFIAGRLGDWPRRSSGASKTNLLPRLVVNAALVTAMTGFAFIHTAQVIQRESQFEDQNFPTGAVTFLATHAIHGPIFNHYDWGGYLIWRLYPLQRVFIDGRSDLYQQNLLDQFSDTYQFRGDWRLALRNWAIATVIVPRESPLATGLRNRPDWTVSYEDKQSIVLTRADPAPQAGGRSQPLPTNSRVNRQGENCQTAVTAGMQEITPQQAPCRLL